MCYNSIMQSKVIQHFKTITKHRHEVMKRCFKVGLYKQGLLHDLSKYSFVEFFNSVKYYTGTCSPIYYERKEKGFSEVYLHHKAHNKHHFEYWYDPYAKDRHAIMPDCYIIESIIDRLVASRIYLKDQFTDDAPYQYFLNDHPITDYMAPIEYEKFSYLLKYLAENGEEALLKLLKDMVKNHCQIL